MGGCSFLLPRWSGAYKYDHKMYTWYSGEDWHQLADNDLKKEMFWRVLLRVYRAAEVEKGQL